MTTDLILPKFNMDMESAVLLKWLRAEGDRVQQGDPVAEVETDKVNMEVEATTDGILFDLSYAEGDTVPVTALIARIAPDEAAVAEARRSEGSASSGASTTESAVEAVPATERFPVPVDRATAPAASATLTGEAADTVGKVRATPAVRRLAREHGIDLANLARNGARVTASSVRAAIEARDRPQATPAATSPTLPVPGVLPSRVSRPPAVPPPPPSLATVPPTSPRSGGVPLDATRRAIAERMTKANEVPQITLNVEVRAGAVIRLRQEIGSRPSFSAIFAVAVARALRDHPGLNCTFEGGMVVPHANVDLGIAVARPAGLIVPVLHDADRLTIVEADRRIRDLVARALDGRLRLEDVGGGTFTITSLGEAGIDHFSPLLNPPQVGILGIGRLAPRVIAVDDAIRVEQTVYLSLTCDHRVIDGEPGAAFLRTLRRFLESPGWLTGGMALGQTLE